MKALILCAGYATRLYPLTENFPKPLLEVGDKRILDWLLEDLVEDNRIEEFIIVSNHKFIEFFEQWRAQSRYTEKIRLLDDGSTSNENRLGAVRDIIYAVKKCDIKEDLLVMAGDNLLDFSLSGFLDYFEKKQASCVMRYFEQDMEKLQKTGVLSLGEEDLCLELQEKPLVPVSNWAVPPFYIYHQRDLVKILRAVQEGGCNQDAPGDLVAWLCKEADVYAYEMPGKRYDFGNKKGYLEIKATYKGRKN